MKNPTPNKINKTFMEAWSEFGDDKSTEFLIQITAHRLGLDVAGVYDVLAEFNSEMNAHKSGSNQP
jgi:hypothetical protein